MTDTSPRPYRPVATFLLLTFALSAIFYALIIHAGRLAAGNGIYVTGLMWCPGLAALLTCRVLGRPISTLGWRWDWRYQRWAFLIPIAYAGAAYVAVWISGLGGFPNRAFLAQVAERFGWAGAPLWLVAAGYVLLTGTVGMVRGTSTALGEEIGWRGFLVPELSRTMSFTSTALVSGIIWAAWHFPILLFADYNSGTPAWYGLTCFTVMVVGISFVFAWLRLRSGSLWTGAVMHASHNVFIQAIFTPLTTDTGKTAYVIDEFGWMLALVAVIAAGVVWARRTETTRAMAGLVAAGT
ncbi:MAG TPA: CPBP family intramembrane glutamic endopeptidase [Gemmatimonadaceae bacterium]